MSCWRDALYVIFFLGVHTQCVQVCLHDVAVVLGPRTSLFRVGGLLLIGCAPPNLLPHREREELPRISQGGIFFVVPTLGHM